VTRPAYDDLAREQVARAMGERTSAEAQDEDLQTLINGVDTWEVSEDGLVTED